MPTSEFLFQKGEQKLTFTLFLGCAMFFHKLLNLILKITILSGGIIPILYL